MIVLSYYPYPHQVNWHLKFQGFWLGVRILTSCIPDLFTIVKLMSWAVVLKVTTGICYNLKFTWFRIVSCSGAMTEMTDFALHEIMYGHHDCPKRQNAVLCHRESAPAFLFHLFWIETRCLNPSSVSVSWALVLREIFKGRVEKLHWRWQWQKSAWLCRHKTRGKSDNSS